MKSCGILAASLFGAFAAAAPIDIVWVTHTAVDIVTIPMTKTVWVGAGEAYRPTHTVTVSSETEAASSSSVYVAPESTSSSFSSVYVAPTISSTSVHVAPTSSWVYVEPSSSVYVAPTTSSVYVAPTTSSVYVAPTTSSVSVAPTTSSISVYVAPTTTEVPTSTYVAPSSSSSAPAATSTSSSGSGSGLAASGTSYTGDLTWYQVGSGACGEVNVASDLIVAISEEIFDAPEYKTANPNLNPLCGRYVSITGKDGNQHRAKVVDRCTGCKTADLDLSEDFFNTVTANGDGRVSGMSWTWE
ncbi:hypothetical protein AAFC00_002541 [Neodothiora populina]|uniref:Uncharacterized protein n=1 Tax=Neodothiora populina TaxID=2781224 RepID=A0ABR3P8T0_9PEZI